MFFQRIFCKYLCPLGAFIAFLAPLGMTAIERNTKSCTQCLACDKVCPVNIQVSRLNKVTSLECIQCQECVNVCPEAKTLELKISGKKIVLYAAIWYDLKTCKLIRFPSLNLKKIFRLIAEPGALPHLPLQGTSGQAQLE